MGVSDMDKNLRRALIAGIILISLSIAYALVYRPWITNYRRQQCVNTSIQKAVDIYSQDHPNTAHQYQPLVYDAWFKRCLQSKGISN